MSNCHFSKETKAENLHLVKENTVKILNSPLQAKEARDAFSFSECSANLTKQCASQVILKENLVCLCNISQKQHLNLP